MQPDAIDGGDADGAAYNIANLLELVIEGLVKVD